MRILALGDVVGEPGRRLVEAFLPDLRRETGADLVVVNGENAAHGHGITDTIAREWFDRYGVDVITTGNHAFDVKGIDAYFRQEPRLLRPANHPPDTAGNGWVKLHTPSGAEVLIINLMGRVHMPACDCPFRCVDGILQKERADLVFCLFGQSSVLTVSELAWKSHSLQRAFAQHRVLRGFCRLTRLQGE